MTVELRPHQEDVLRFLGNGKVLYGGTGSGKSITSLAYYMQKESPKDVYVITTARKRDSLEWQGDAAKFGIGRTNEASLGGVLTVDSWNNISRYEHVSGAFFIFDEQRIVGHGAWVKSFLRIVRSNRWILLSATPGDSWIEYAPIFIANGWYKNITQFKREHVVYAPYVRYPRIARYIGTGKLERLRNACLVEMPYESKNERVMNYLEVGYDKERLIEIQKTRWHKEESRPLVDAGDMWRYMRRVVNTDESRLEVIRHVLTMHPKLIIWYNLNYELDILRTLGCHIEVAEWNGQKHEAIPSGDKWVYLVQYAAGAEGWNCTATDAMCFYSLTYSYKQFTQALGRNDRLDSPFTRLYNYVLKSGSIVDRQIGRAMEEKRDFNMRNDGETALERQISYTF